jgi:regulator of nucleoside diphosphate kinase
MSPTPDFPPLSERPPLLLGAGDHQRLEQLAERALDELPDIAGPMLDELARAVVVEPGQLPDDAVAVGREVRYRDEITGKDRVVRLVWPAHADPDHDRISVLTPVGAALIGLSVGQSIEWPLRDGQRHRLRVCAVRP